MKRIITTLKEKWPEYLLEILVITIGILGAYTLNNWNEERKERIQEQLLLKQLKREYVANLHQLDRKIATRNIILQSSKELLSYFDHPETATRDLVISRLSDLGMTVTYDPIDNDLVRSGSISIIKNDELRELLTMWSTDVIQVQEVETIYLNRYYYYTSPYISHMGIERELDNALWQKIPTVEFLLNNEKLEPYDFGKSKNAMTLVKILDNSPLESYISSTITINELINRESYTLRNQILEILTLLDQEIK